MSRPCTRRKQNRRAKAIQKDLFNLTALDLDSFDVVVDAFGAMGRGRASES